MPEPDAVVSFLYDAPEVSATEFAAELLATTTETETGIDSYSIGGAVEEFETAFARLIGKEKAVFMPTGTLANHLAVRMLMRGKSRVLLQERGHLYNDSGDCLQKLSGINAVALGRGKATFGLDEVKAAFENAEAARVEASIGAIAIETPVRRMHGELFDQGEMEAICDFARGRGVGLHLDGARLFIASAYSGIPVDSYASAFDTVYISLYKYFNAPSGAVLAGPARLMDGLYHERRMFGGGLNQAWIFAATALRSLTSFQERFAQAVAVSEVFKQILAGIPGLAVSNIPGGTNVFKLIPRNDIDPSSMHDTMSKLGVKLPPPESGTFYLKVNESILSTPPAELAGRFAEAVRAKG
jgi:threonine aldolase